LPPGLKLLLPITVRQQLILPLLQAAATWHLATGWQQLSVALPAWQQQTGCGNRQLSSS